MSGSSNKQLAIPYFDSLPQRFREGDADALIAFGRHLHWGYWPDPSEADGSVGDLAVAAENLSRLVTDMADVKNGLRILDVGCGFGGTLASLNERFCNLYLVGVNINQQQLSRAKETVQGLPTNHIEFTYADACQLPFAENSFDVVLAVESIFAFPSREEFFRQTRRVLHPGGRLIISDFLPIEAYYRTWKWIEKATKTLIFRTYGSSSINFCPLSKYEELAELTGFKLVDTKDINSNVLPTYPVVNSLMRRKGSEETYRATRGLEMLSRRRLLRYTILSFEVPFL